jgi:hypothetical protein
MPIAKITGEGLVAISMSVALLWTCVIGQRALADRAYAERVQVMRNSPHGDVRPRTLPVSAPGPRHTPARTISAG